MSNIYSFSSGATLENSEALEAEQAINRIETFLKKEDEWISILVYANKYCRGEFEEEKIFEHKKLYGFFLKEEEILGKTIDKNLYNDYFFYISRKLSPTRTSKLPSFLDYQMNARKKEEEGRQEFLKRYEEPERSKIVDLLKSKNQYIENVEPQPEQNEHPAVTMLQDLQGSQPETQQVRFRDRLKNWFKSW